MLCYKFDVLEALKTAGYNTKKLRDEKILSESTIQKLRKNETVSIDTIETLCRILNMKPGDIIDYSGNEDSITKIARVYKHYGVIVAKGFEDDFIGRLSRNGIEYNFLPVYISGMEVISYRSKGVKKYAVIMRHEDGQTVYVTTDIPDDLDWKKLVKDIDNQISGHPAMEMESKLHLVLDTAIKNVPVKESTSLFMMAPGPTPREVATELIMLGYGKEDIKAMAMSDNHDVDPDYLQDVLNAF